MSLSHYVFNRASGKDHGEAVQATKDSSMAYQISGQGAADASEKAAAEAAEGEQNALAYMQEREALPMAFRDAAYSAMAPQYGLTYDELGNVVSDGSTIEDRTLASPYYNTMLSQGESAIGRNASATGRLRGGATATDLGANAQNAYMGAYQQQLQGLNSFMYGPNNTQNIANSMSNIGNINAMGTTASAEARQAGAGNIAGLALTAFSDPRLKKGAKVIGSENGLNVYEWDWNEKAEALGLSGSDTGHMADEVYELYPHLVGESSGYMTVNYGGLPS